MEMWLRKQEGKKWTTNEYYISSNFQMFLKTTVETFLFLLFFIESKLKQNIVLLFYAKMPFFFFFLIQDNNGREN